MDTIKCPACGTEVEVGTENCPSCGAPVGVINEDNIAGVPIDNRAAIDTMLRSASRLVDESQSLGIGTVGKGDADDAGDEKDFKRVKLTELPPELSEKQKDEIKSGGVINLSPDNKAAASIPSSNNNSVPAAGSPVRASDAAVNLPGADIGIPGSSPDPDVENAPGITLFEMDEDGNVIEPEEDEKKKKKPKEKKPKPKKDKPDKSSSTKSAKSKKSKGSGISSVLAVVVALAIGLAGGFFGKMFFFPEFVSPDCQEFAEKAVKSVNHVKESGEKIFVMEAYVKDFTNSRQCIIRAVSEKDNNAEIKWYRVKVDNDDKQKIHVYLQLSQEEYESLKNSDNKEDQIRASVLMNAQSETERCVEEMKNGDGWESANTALLNNAINPYTPSEKTDKKTSEADKTTVVTQNDD